MKGIVIMSHFFKNISVFFLISVFSLPILAASPRLVVLVAVDQLRPDRLHADMPGGLGRLMREGHVFTQATLAHGLTSTCPGHVVISTGVNPSKAGIPGNSYIDHETMAKRYCVDDEDETFKVHDTSDIRSPNALTATTLGDWLKQKSPRARVFAVAGKDRASITLGGKQADGVFWYSSRAGRFTSSGYYGELPGYVKAFNGNDFFVDGYGGKAPSTWEHSSGSLRPDDYVGESRTYQRVSGHPVNHGVKRGVQYHYSPFVDLATDALARRVIEAERLGQRGVTDMLALSFSATDLVGHLYGPFSAESEDALQKLDAVLGDFLNYLDARLGSEYLLALTADHGVLPLPEWLDETGGLICPVAGGRINNSDFWLRWHLYWNFTLPFGNPADLIGYSASGITVNADYAATLGVTVDEVVSFH